MKAHEIDWRALSQADLLDLIDAGAAEMDTRTEEFSARRNGTVKSAAKPGRKTNEERSERATLNG